MGQDGPVWFLAGTPGGPVTRDCTIPEGKQLYFPLVNTWVTWRGREWEIPEIMESVVAYFEFWHKHTCTLILRLDGEEVVAGGFDTMVERLWVKTYEPFEAVFNNDNYLPLTGGCRLGVPARWRLLRADTPACPGRPRARARWERMP
jgi:hypothetical protein